MDLEALRAKHERTTFPAQGDLVDAWMAQMELVNELEAALGNVERLEREALAPYQDGHCMGCGKVMPAPHDGSECDEVIIERLSEEVDRLRERLRILIDVSHAADAALQDEGRADAQRIEAALSNLATVRLWWPFGAVKVLAGEQKP